MSFRTLNGHPLNSTQPINGKITLTQTSSAAMFVPTSIISGRGGKHTSLRPQIPTRLANSKPRAWFPFNEPVIYRNHPLANPSPFEYFSPHPYSGNNGDFLVRPDGTWGYGDNADSFSIAPIAGGKNFLPSSGTPWTALFGGWYVVKADGNSAYFYINNSGSPWHYFRLPGNYPYIFSGDSLWQPFGTTRVVEHNNFLNFGMSYDGGVRFSCVAQSPTFNDGRPKVAVTTTHLNPWNTVATDYLFSYFQYNSTFGVWGSYGEVISLEKHMSDSELLNWAGNPYGYWREPQIFYIGATAAAPSNDVEVNLPAPSVGVTAYVPDVYVQFDAFTDLPAPSVGITPYAPQVETVIESEDVFVDLPPTAEIQNTAFVPTVGVANDVFTDLPAPTVQVSPYNPVVDIGDDTFVNLPAPEVGIVAYVPTVEVEGGADVTLPAPQVALSGALPDVYVGEGVYVDLPAAVLQNVAYAPSTTLVGNVEVDLPAPGVNFVGIPPRVMVGEDVDVTDPDRGVAGIVAGDVADEVTDVVKT